MCGIVGFLNFDPTSDRTRARWIKNALLVDELRGSDSTGLALMPSPSMSATAPLPSMRVYKRALRAADFLQMDSTSSLLNMADDCTLVIGHNRAATTGDKGSDSNAHPFAYGHITMVHNGTLTTRNGLEQHHPVDSASIAMQLERTDPSNYAKLLSELHGAFTLVWFNSENNKMYFARNDQRPLMLGYGWDKRTLFYASEQWMITSLIPRIDDKCLDIRDDGYYDSFKLPTNELWEFDVYGDSATHTVTPFEDYTPPVVVNNYKSNSGGSGKWVSQFRQYDHVGWPDYNDDFDYMAPVSKPIVPVDIGAKCPVEIGDTIFADSWEFTPSHGKKGTITGKSVDHDNVCFVVPNVQESQHLRFVKDLADWERVMSEDKDVTDDTFWEPYMTGQITQVTTLQGARKGTYVVTLKPKTVSVDLIAVSDSEEDTKEEIILQ